MDKDTKLTDKIIILYRTGIKFCRGLYKRLFVKKNIWFVFNWKISANNSWKSYLLR